MSHHHLDRPIRRIPAVRPVSALPSDPVDHVGAGGRLALRIARAFYRTRLRQRRRRLKATAHGV